ncbi:MAG: F0F1 ATP synthase subunit B [Bacteroidales bacterium]|nr:F0F1 ATP synthase subunit B [Bacteroidales bacterium]MCM1147372.1 F0F1 ATP synthase subunit B [Bacteroidales bacterium]MCM1207193.1 F0F1 ATP synthase subunit B [Bacillota bacterium]MCM1510426.1 F0F1 ATP synthase subunit B [Clostridium sp.]
MDLSNLPAVLTPDSGLLFWMLLAFLVVFFVLAKKGFPAIINMVEERKAYIDESLRKAHEANEKLANIQAEGEKMLLEARERQSQIVKEAQATRDNMIAQAEVKAREESARIIAEAKAQIETEKKNAIADIRQQVSVLSVGIAEKILRQKLSDDKSQMVYVDKLLDDISSYAKQ